MFFCLFLKHTLSILVLSDELLSASLVWNMDKPELTLTLALKANLDGIMACMPDRGITNLIFNSKDNWIQRIIGLRRVVFVYLPVT